MSSLRCAACTYMRRRCSSTCIFSPYFPPSDPQKFVDVHKIFGASNVSKMLQKVPEHQRAKVADSLYLEAYCRIKDPVYGCVEILGQLLQQIQHAQRELAIVQAEIAVLNNEGQRATESEQASFAPVTGTTIASFEGSSSFEETVDSPLTGSEPSVTSFY